MQVVSGHGKKRRARARGSGILVAQDSCGAFRQGRCRGCVECFAELLVIPLMLAARSIVGFDVVKDLSVRSFCVK